MAPTSRVRITPMRRLTLLMAVAGVGCGSGNPENSAACGFASIAGATMVLEQMSSGTKVLQSIPDGLRGTVPARVAGFGTAPAVVDSAAAGPVLRYRGHGFPATPGFGLALVEDSADTFKGVLVYDLTPPQGYPRLGTVTDGRLTIPLFGLRVAWAAVSDPRCPLFGPIDTTATD